MGFIILTLKTGKVSLGLGIANELLETPLPVLADEGGLGTNLMIWYQNGVGVSRVGEISCWETIMQSVVWNSSAKVEKNLKTGEL